MNQSNLISDRVAIEDVVKRFCVASDRMDWPLLHECFHPRAAVDFGAFVKGPVEDYFAFVESPDGQSSLTRTMHVVSNVLIELSGDRADVESYCVAYHVGPGDHAWCRGSVTVGLRWVDRFERRDGRWAIAARTCVFEWGRNESTGEAMEFPPESMGRRDRTDLRYERSTTQG